MGFPLLLRTLRGLAALTSEAKGIRLSLEKIASMMERANWESGMGDPDEASVGMIDDRANWESEAFFREKEAELGRELLPHEIARWKKRRRES